MLRSLLIANRGEIAVRVARTARRMGLRTIAVFSDADRDAPHVRACDEAVHIGAAAPSESYLRIEAIIEAARRTGAEAVHPGYGFLSENAAFADALDAAGVVFVGPTAETIRAMGSKAAAKDLMAHANVPTTPGYQGDKQDLATFKREAKRIGYPVLLKATAGGGGKGMRLVARADDLDDALASARREARAAFGDDRFLVEKYIPRARHVEVQIFGDGAGDVVHMFERDCSVQRRHQKIIEEAPAPRLPPDVRARLLAAGVEAGRAVQYRGAGTVEFLYDGADGVYFMEMNTRLQVEHPVSEAITGLDFVEWQLRIASGEGLPLRQNEIIEHGAAFEARVYAEDPARNFAPSIGTATTLRLPHDEARVDAGVAAGQQISPYYDPMIAKIITHGATRAEALGRLRRALKRTRIAGLETNVAFLHALADHDAFAAGEVSTRFIDEHNAALFAPLEAGEAVYAAIAVHRLRPTADHDPWRALSGFRLNAPPRESIWVEHRGAAALLSIARYGDRFEAELQPNAAAAARRKSQALEPPIRFAFRGFADEDGTVRLELDRRTIDAFVAPHGAGLRVWLGARSWDVALPDPLAGVSAHPAAEGSLTAPMPGLVTALCAAPGNAVAGGAPLLRMEAMKMEHAIKAPFDGIVHRYRFAVGDQVKTGDLLVEFEETDA